MVSEGSTLALTVGSPSAHRRYSALKHLAFMLLFLLGSLNVWGTEYELVYSLNCATASANGSQSAYGVNSTTVMAGSGVKAFLNAAAGSTLVSNDATVSGSVYWAKGSGGPTGTPDNVLKVGKASGGGSISFTIGGDDNISKVVVVGYVWKTTSSISVNSATAQTYGTTGTSHDFIFEDLDATKTISISVTTSAVCVTGINLYKTKSGSGSTPTPLDQVDNLVASSVTTSGATLSWDAVENASSYKLTIGDNVIENATSPYAATGLEEDTEYTWSVQAIGDGVNYSTSDAVDGPNFTTLDDPSTDKVVYDFHSSATLYPDGFPTSGTNVASAEAFTIDGKSVIINAPTSYYIINSNNDASRALFFGKTSAAYLEFPAKVGYKLTKMVVIAGANCGATKCNVYNTSSEAVSTQITASASANMTFAIATEKQVKNAAYRLQIDESKNLQVAYVSLFYEAVAPAAVEKPTISGTESFLESTEVTLACTTDGATIYYSTDGSDPKTSGTTGTSFTLFNDATVRAIAKKDEAWSEEATPKAFTKKTPITVAQALDIIEALPNKTATTEDYLVEGTISTITSVTVGGTAEYYISADGTTTNELQVYKGKYKNQANFTSVDDIQEGDDVVIYGKLKKYNTYKELDQDNYVYSQKAKARLSWSAASYTASMSGGNSFPILTNTNEVAVTYSSSDPSVASFTNASDYSTLTLNAAGTGVTITATFEGNSTYKANTATYTLNVEAAVERGTITFDVDGGDAIASIPDATELPNPLPIPTKAGKNFVAWFTNSGKTDEAVAGAAVTEDITLYAKWREPYTITEALAIIATYGNNEGGTNDVYVAGIVSTAPSSNPSSGRLTYSISADGTASDEIKVYLGKGVDDDPFSNKTDVQLNDKVIVYGKLYKYEKNSEITPEVNTPNHLYSLSRKAEADLDWSASSAVVGITGDKVYPTIVNPHSLMGITYSSSDPTVASFADENTYAMTLHKAGTVTITASFDGDEDYKNDEASYTLEVRDALVYVTITYDCDGATTGCPDPATIENQTNLPNLLPTVTKDGFKFGGWFTNAGKTEAATAGAALTDNVTLYAKWIEIPTFDNSGYEWQLVTSDAQLVADQYYVMGRATNSAVASNTLSGGYLSKVAVTYTDGGIAYNGFATAPTTKTANEASVAVFLLGGNSTDGWTLTEVLGAETGLLGGAGSTNFAWGGNSTVWPITIDGSGEAVIGTASAERVLYNVSSPRFKPYGSGTETSNTMVLPQLYVWAEKSFKLRYDANGGDDAPTATPAVAGKVTVTDAKPTAPSGKIFDGWNENASGTGANYSAGDEVIVSGADVTIYAKWRDPVDYTVTYDANGGTLIEGKSEIDPQDITEGHQVTVAANVYEKEGFVFGGWKYGENIYSANQKFTMPAENVKLVALWASLNVTDFMLVTDVKQLKDGDKVYIVADGNYNVALGELSGNVRNPVEIAKSNAHIVNIGNNPVELTLGKDGNDYTFYDGANYLAWTSGNTLTNASSVSDNSTWNITINEGVTKIANKDDGTRELQYNSSDPRFAAYTSAQKAVAIYKRPDYSRDVTEGRFGTICLPKAGKMDGAAIYEVAYIDNSLNKIFFDEVMDGAMSAGMPYIFLPNAGIEKLGVYYSDNTAEDEEAPAGNYHGLYGSYDKVELSTGGDNYILLNNQYCQVINANVSVGAYRAYIQLSQVPTTGSAPAPGRRRISMGVQSQNAATGMDELNASETPVKMLINGQLFILRGEKMYNANGQLVK